MFTEEVDTSDPATTIDPDGVEVSVTCNSCGQTVDKEGARRYVVGDLKKRETEGTTARYDFVDSTVQEGWICRYCYDTGPAGYNGADEAGRPWAFIVGVLMVLLAIAMGFVTLASMLIGALPIFSDSL